MDNMTWYQGKRLKRIVDDHRPFLGIPHLAVAVILMAREQGKTLEDIVQELILANEYEAATTKLDKDATIRDLGF